MKQLQAVLLSAIDSIGGVIFWIKIKSVVLTESIKKEDKINEGLYA